TKEQEGMIQKVRNFIAYGEIDKDVFKMVLEKRGQLIDKTKKIDVEKVLDEIEKGKSYEELNLKPFFRLHPPRGGIDTKKPFGKGKGVIGYNEKKINDLVKRMI
ncbi:MAG: 50S ribosomal protein L30, partial [Candidatus Pacearchaeota archaeon]